MRGASLLLGLLPCLALAEPPRPVGAAYAMPTDRYAHDVLGRIPPWGALVVDLEAEGARRRLRVVLPPERVFEDIAPRLWDVTGDGRPEVVVVESDLSRGARLAVWSAVAGPDGPALAPLAATPFIGTRHRWLAPLAAADLDGDGQVELAYVETPHLGRTLRVVRRAGDALEAVASLGGVTAHAIGEEAITGGLRACGDGPPEIVALSADRTRVLAIRLASGRLEARDAGPAAAGAVAAALACGR